VAPLLPMPPLVTEGQVEPIRCGSYHQGTVSLRFRVKNVGSRNGIHQKSATHAYREDGGIKDHGWALMDEGSTTLMSDEDDPTVADAVALAVGEDDGTYKIPSK
jgi:hypothetical protein